MLPKETIGRVEKAHFNELGLLFIDTKVDTGAYTSSIHCEHIHLKDNKLYCNFLDSSHPDYHHKQLIFEDYQKKTVKSSNGVTQERFVIRTHIKIGPNEYDIELTLADRAEMKYPVLLGRKFLTSKFVVDVSKPYLLSQKRKKMKKKLKIIILSRSRHLYSTKRLQEAGQKRGHQMHIVDHTK